MPPGLIVALSLIPLGSGNTVGACKTGTGTRPFLWIIPKAPRLPSPVALKKPPTYKLLLVPAITLAVLFKPVPSVDHDCPFQTAILFAELPPALVKVPTTYTLLALTKISLTVKLTPAP